MSIVKGKEILNKSEVKNQIGYLSVNLSPEQWKLVKSNKLKVNVIADNSDKVYQDKTGEQQLDMRLSINNETINIKVLDNEKIEEILELSRKRKSRLFNNLRQNERNYKKQICIVYRDDKYIENTIKSSMNKLK